MAVRIEGYSASEYLKREDFKRTGLIVRIRDGSKLSIQFPDSSPKNRCITRLYEFEKVVDITLC